MSDHVETSLKPFFLQFFGTYIALYILLAAIVFILKIDNFSASNVIVTMSSGYMVAGTFLKRERRPPRDDERKKLVWGSLLIMISIELVFALIVIFAGGTEELDGIVESGHIALIGGILAVVILLFLLVDFFVLRWVYGSQAQRMYDRM